MPDDRLVQTAWSISNKCFICKSRNHLHRINPASIIYAYKHLRIFIRQQTRSCSRHLYDKRNIKYDEFPNIPTRLIAHNMQTIFFLNTMLQDSSLGIIDRFKDMASLDDDICIDISGWKKADFIRFTNYITSIRDTNGRTKEQPIAIYRLWLRKGLDYASISKMKNDTSAQQIRHYLAQIREAINKDILPLFLGAKHLNRRDFLLHNNITTTVLHDLRVDDLAVIADGTYCRIEKSSNNTFQYNSWSEQKKDNLIKPFTICCSDGYFIYCYGPFQANQNDSTILQYILESDQDLVDLLVPNKTIIFLDRGFRDIVKKIIDQYKIIVKIPTIQQNQESSDDEINEKTKKKTKQLTTKQANRDRFVTKVRFIVEKQNSILKNYTALENIRNTELGHIQIDYRIACAMSNFFHRPICPDGEKAEKIAERMIIRSSLETNDLEFLLTRQLDTEYMSNIVLDDIDDFPILKKKHLKDYILFSSYKLRQCKSYLTDLVNNSRAYLATNKLAKLKDLKNNVISEQLLKNQSKIIAIEISSRHRRSQYKNDNNIIVSEKENSDDEQEEQNYKLSKRFKNTYKVFIQYIPTNENILNRSNYKRIQGYICSCASGHTIVGACVHVATFLYYLSYSRYKEIIKLPGEHLQKIFVDFIKKDSPNKPRYIRKKHAKELSSSSDSTSDEDNND